VTNRVKRPINVESLRRVLKETLSDAANEPDKPSETRKSGALKAGETVALK
jgi:hypothetical protein